MLPGTAETNQSVTQSIYLSRNITDTGPDTRGRCKLRWTSRCPWNI